MQHKDSTKDQIKLLESFDKEVEDDLEKIPQIKVIRANENKLTKAYFFALIAACCYAIHNYIFSFVTS